VDFCHGLGASEQALAHGSLCREAMSEKHISNHVVDGRREWDREIHVYKQRKLHH